MTYLILAFAALLVVLLLVWWWRQGEAPAPSAVELARARAAERQRQRVLTGPASDLMLFSSERPFMMDDEETGIVVRVLDGWDAEVEK